MFKANTTSIIIILDMSHYLCTVYLIIYLLFIIVAVICLKTLHPGQIMTEFEELKPFYYKEKLNSVTSGVRPFHFLCLLLQLSLVSQVKSFRAK